MQLCDRPGSLLRALLEEHRECPLELDGWRGRALRRCRRGAEGPQRRSLPPQRHYERAVRGWPCEGDPLQGAYRRCLSLDDRCRWPASGLPVVLSVSREILRGHVRNVPPLAPCRRGKSLSCGGRGTGFPWCAAIDAPPAGLNLLFLLKPEETRL